MAQASLFESNYVILTREQFVNDYGASNDIDVPDDAARVLVFYTDTDDLIGALWADRAAHFASFTADLAKYAAAQVDPGPVQAKVGNNTTVIGGR